MGNSAKKIGWMALAVLGAFCLGTIALRRGEQINALWIVAAAISIYLIAYRFYSLFIADKVLGLDGTRATPAVLNNDGLDYVPTNRYVLFGHHFAAIAGAGPLVGPVLAAQMGYLPGTAVVARRRGAGRRGAGFHGAGDLQPPRRPLAGRPDARGDGPGARHDRAVRRLPDHDHHPRGAGADRGQGAGRQSVGHVHGDGDDPDRDLHGRLHALHPPGQDRRDLGDRARPAARFDLVRRPDRRPSDLGSRCSPSPARSSPGC